MLCHRSHLRRFHLRHLRGHLHLVRPDYPLKLLVQYQAQVQRRDQQQRRLLHRHRLQLLSRRTPLVLLTHVCVGLMHVILCLVSVSILGVAMTQDTRQTNISILIIANVLRATSSAILATPQIACALQPLVLLHRRLQHRPQHRLQRPLKPQVLNLHHCRRWLQPSLRQSRQPLVPPRRRLIILP